MVLALVEWRKPQKPCQGGCYSKHSNWAPHKQKLEITLPQKLTCLITFNVYQSSLPRVKTENSTLTSCQGEEWEIPNFLPVTTMISNKSVKNKRVKECASNKIRYVQAGAKTKHYYINVQEYLLFHLSIWKPSRTVLSQKLQQLVEYVLSQC